ncbi:MAG TPA: aldehyde dehydrogenase family protein, partial [Acidimicrobiales bacterium]|nr:aldehyde dehydrogenase family protein [Acidimicrobiales bacterium]
MSARRTASVGGVDVALDHYIGGDRAGSATTFEDRSPIDWSLLLGDVARGDAETAAAAVGAAAAAAAGWAALGTSGRGAILRRLADLIDARTEELAIVECLDMAMLLRSLRARVIARGARNFRAYADLAAAHRGRVWSSGGTANRVLRRPAGPAVVITPWNAP